MVIGGFMCEVCREMYDSRQIALECEKSHDTLKFEPKYYTGERFPDHITVYRMSGGDKTEVCTYIRDKDGVRKINE
jgi:hypothetical protein